MRAGNLGYCFALVVLILGQPALAAHMDLESKLADCAAITSTSQRLNCYDVLAKSLRLKGDGEGGKAHASWIVSSQVSPMDDGTNVYLRLRSEHVVETRYFGKVRPTLWLQCVRGVTKGVLEWGFIVGGGMETVTYRLDQDEPRTIAIKVSEDFSAHVSWDKERVVRFIKSLFGKKRLLVEIKPFSDPPVMATFNVTGTETSIGSLRTACGW